jgi:GGDEF-like domain/PucR C-terminal helix-turn-helix domain
VIKAAAANGHSREPAARPRSQEDSCAILKANLEARRPEIEQAALTRIGAILSPDDSPKAAQGVALRKGIDAALDCTFAVLEEGGVDDPLVPSVLLAQARLAARGGLKLDTLLRRYFAGHALFCDFIVEEAAYVDHLDPDDLQRLLRDQAELCDRLLAAASEEYARERRHRFRSADRRRTELVEHLLAGQLADVSRLDYDFDGHHLGMIASGSEPCKAIRELAAILDRRLLSVSPVEDTVWAWLGGRHPIDADEAQRVVSSRWPTQLSLAMGEPGEGMTGWRLSHRQARAAHKIALRSREPVVHYVDVALLAAGLQDDLLTTSLRCRYLEPLERERDGGVSAKETLRAYFATDRNISSAAAALGVNRNTISSRLRAIETAIGRPLSSCGPELETALRIAELDEAELSPADQGRRLSAPHTQDNPASSGLRS